MRILSAFLLIAVTALAFGHSVHRSHDVSSDGTEISIVQDSDGEHWASFARNGVKYVTTDSRVLGEIEKVMEPHRRLGREHSELGRRHSDLGRQHSELGREHSRLGREHSRLGREISHSGHTSDLERQQRDLEAEQRKLEEKQRKLEDRQRDLEDEQRELESKQRAMEKDVHRAIEQIFERAVREGKARRK